MMRQPQMPEQGGDLLARARSVNSDTTGILISTLDAAGARRVLDIGCGDGAIAGLLAEAGFDVTGVDPDAGALDRARARFPGLRFTQARAEALPLDLPAFDAACLVNSLHHVAPSAMAAALLGAVAAVRPGGPILVIEPVAQGSFYRVMRPVEDETEIRDRALRVIESLISEERVVLRDLRRWNRESRFTDMDEFVNYLARGDHDRALNARRNAAALARAWRENIRSRDGKAVLVQPLVCWTLAAGPRAGTVQP